MYPFQALNCLELRLNLKHHFRFLRMRNHCFTETSYFLPVDFYSLLRFFDRILLSFALVLVFGLFQTLLHPKSKIFLQKLFPTQGLLAAAFSLRIQLSPIEHARVFILLHPLLSENADKSFLLIERRLPIKDLAVVRAGQPNILTCSRITFYLIVLCRVYL